MLEKSHEYALFCSILARRDRKGIEKGFRIGFDYDQHFMIPCRNNMLSIQDHLQVVTDYLQQELQEGSLS